LNPPADALVQSATSHWPRLLQNGVDYGDFVRTTARIDSWDQWLPQWTKTADAHVERAHAAAEANHTVTAGQAWRQAAISRHFCKFVWTVDPELYAEATGRTARSCSARCTTAERLVFDFESDTAYGTLDPSIPRIIVNERL
jgi:hypothetical protein